MIVREALKEAIARFTAADVPSSGLAAELLLMRAVKRDKTWIYAHPEAALDSATEHQFLTLVEQRAAGTPTQYLTGHQEFWGLDFEVGPGVLIPRPETEHLIEVVLERLNPARRSDQLLLTDVGTGSGCIAVALATEFTDAKIVATDISPEALKIAHRNAVRHGVEGRIKFLLTDLLENAGRGYFHAVVSNPPYVPLLESSDLPREVREHEPESALFAGRDGLDVYRRLTVQAAAALRPGGLLVMEMGHSSLPAVRSLLEESGQWHDLQITNDLAGIPRVISAKQGGQQE
jgi:release factor glutamine methyltransferase